ncbi:MAG: TrpR-like protein, YerC/YecD [Ruminococcaceae bacterium]|nr:TrpR-like protein, YerC/YecD [Oscillospiraceae bacterium]
MEYRKPDDSLEYLIRGILTLQTPEECLRFFQDLCTASELQEMSRRLQAAKLLNQNYIYSEIADRTGLSTATISRVNRCLKFGNDGYLTVLNRVARKK